MKTREKRKNLWQGNGGFLYVLPSLLLITLFYLIPLVMTGYFSFTDYSVLKPPTWTGLENFKKMLGDTIFSPSNPKYDRSTRF